MPQVFDNCWFLTGATAVGKTSVGIALAEQLGAEIISLDSMAIYRGMDIGTAKPSRELRERVPHRLIDIINPSDEFSVSQYIDAAAIAVDQIRARDRVPLFVGGTPLYLKSLLRGLFNGPPADWNLRQEIEQALQHVGELALHERLTQVDPVAASHIHPHDTRRLIRALEVFRATGEPISHQQLQFEDGRPAEECRVFVLRRTREELHSRIEARVRLMLEAGLVDEARDLTSRGGELSRTARQAVGYYEALAYLAGEYNHDEMLARITYRTRRFAKRQGTWFRSLSECRFIDIAGDSDAAEIARGIAAL
ncbi:MAG TPA: tRNA (adenosine(37)-N6)-dimethylallyltransferase MiaA [Lacipirellulaceae bacterium]|jgi:tRNA dimethylallyltransferase|nr:tRNA (adenosine(37)-N6)-dimethylallyltransferase MiaA [Lacipirellulaceae bacterium]